MPAIKEQLIKVISSLAFAAVFVFIFTTLPAKKEAQLSLTLKLKGNFLLIDYISPLKSKGMISIDQILTAEIQSLDELILAQQNIIDECKMLRVDKGDYLIKSKLGKYTLKYILIVDQSVKLENCVSQIKNEMNSRTQEWIERIIRILDYSKDRVRMEADIESDIAGIDISSQQKKLYDLIRNIPTLRNIKNIETDIRILEDFMKFNNYYDVINPSLILPKRPNLLNYLVMCFLATFIVLNIRIIIETLKKY